MEILKNKFLSYVYQMESIFFETDRNIFIKKHCNKCDKNENYPNCEFVLNSPYGGISCLISYLYKYLRQKGGLNINWFTISFVSPDRQYLTFNHYNFAEDIKKMRYFYEYFSENKNFSITRELFGIKRNSKLFFEKDGQFYGCFLFETTFTTNSIEIASLDDDCRDKKLKIEVIPEDIKIYRDKMASFSGIKKLNYLYFVAYKDVFLKDELRDFYGIYIPSEEEIEERKIKEVAHIIQIFLSPIEKLRRYYRIKSEENRKKTFALSSAIAAIMSRNMSHNIGSHVIADMVANGTENNQIELNVFYRYLQNRMDFIAQITTEIPEWTYPAYFHQELMRVFYENFLLLDRVGVSEGLKAYEWEEDWRKSCMRRKIIVRTGINRMKDSSRKDNFKWIINEFRMDNKLKNDLKLAVPGGIVGYHAFYIIIENMIRNSGKHDYAVRVPTMLDDKDSEGKSLPENKQRKGILIIKRKPNHSIIMISIEPDKKNRVLTYEEIEDSNLFKRFKAVLIESSCIKEPNIKDEKSELIKNLQINDKKYLVMELRRIYIACHDEKCDCYAFVSDNRWGQASLSYHFLSYHEWKELDVKIDDNKDEKPDEKYYRERYNSLLKYLLGIPLRINIRIDDMGKKDYAWVTIWDDMPQYTQDNFTIKEDTNREVSGNVDEKKIKVRKFGPNGNINLFGFLNDRLRQSFIKETGELKKEDWGLAELKICAGYMQNRSPQEIGDNGGKIIDYGTDCFALEPESKYIIDEKDNPNRGYPKMIIKAIPVNKTGNEELTLDTGDIYFLGYRFWMKKPKIVAITGECPAQRGE